MKIGRNHLCSCGSGKKYKHCCLLLPDNPYADSVPENPATAVSDDLAHSHLQAFPMVLSEVETSSYAAPDVTFKRCYVLRCLHRFAGLLGLAEIKAAGSPVKRESLQLRATPLLGAAVQFTGKAVRSGGVAH